MTRLGGSPAGGPVIQYVCVVDSALVRVITEHCPQPCFLGQKPLTERGRQRDSDTALARVAMHAPLKPLPTKFNGFDEMHAGHIGGGDQKPSEATSGGTRYVPCHRVTIRVVRHGFSEPGEGIAKDDDGWGRLVSLG